MLRRIGNGKTKDTLGILNFNNIKLLLKSLVSSLTKVEFSNSSTKEIYSERK